jgi:predicted enzyme related to lactoylglutathione lyase
MPPLTRRNLLQASMAIAIPPGIVTLFSGCQQSASTPHVDESPSLEADREPLIDAEQIEKRKKMQIQYLEIVTPDVDALCAQYSKVHGVTFNDPDANLGGARTAKLNGGGLLGIRGPLRDTETPVVRPYMLVDDIKASVAAAADAGAEVALPPMELSGHGTCAIVIHGGIECGLWQL